MAKKLKPTSDDIHLEDHKIMLSEMTEALASFSKALIEGLREDRKEIMGELKEILETQSKLDNSDIKGEIKNLKNWMIGTGLFFLAGILIQSIIMFATMGG